MFDKPDETGSTGDVISQKDHLGDLLVIQVREHVTGMVTKATKPGETTEAIKADVFVIAPDATVSAEYHDTLLFGRVLCGQLKRKVGRSVLGILELGEKESGKNAPYVLRAEVPAAAEQAAVKAMTSRPDAVQETAPAAADEAWGAQPATVGGGAPKPPWE